MPQTVLNPNNSGTISLALAGITPLVEYQCQVIDFHVDSNTSTVETPGTYCADAADTPDACKFRVVITYLQDWGATPSLSQFTNTNKKQLCDFSFEPDIDGIPTVTGQCYVTPSPYGGPASTNWQVGPVDWPMKGEPTYTPAAAFAAAAASDE